MKRLIFVTLAFLFGCSGAGGSRSAFLPVSPDTSSIGASSAAANSASRVLTPIANAKRGKTKVNLTLRIPRRHRGDRAESRHPATISPLTQSMSVQIDGGAVQVFNTTPSSPGCSIGPSGTVCTVKVDAAVGSDTFVVSTYSATSAGGAMLDRGVAVIAVLKGKANTPSITLGPVASSTADTGPGSLRYAVGSANAGDTILLTVPSGSTITLSTPITITNRVSIAGPGVSASARRDGERHDSTTYSGVTLSGGGSQQIFVIKSGGDATISGLIMTQGYAGVTDQPGGAIYNTGTLSLVSDVLTANTSNVDSPFLRRAPRHASRRPQNLHPHCTGHYTYGGALYNHGSLTITGTTFDSNSVSNICGDDGYGGAIYNDEYGVLASSGNLYTNNGAIYGGAVYNGSDYGQATFASDTFSANVGCTAANGCATVCTTPSTTCTNEAEGYGTAIYDDEGPGITVTGSVFENNVAGGNTPYSYGEGGALYLDAGSPSITGSTFTGNVAGGSPSNCGGGEAGAIYVDSDGPMELDNDTFSGNVAGGDDYGYGGAIYAYSPVQGSNDTFTSNQASAKGSICGTDAYTYGGAIYTDSSSAPVSLNNSTFSGNVATAAYESYGGAVLLYGRGRFIGDTFTSNQAIGTGTTDEYTYADGGAIYSDGDGLTIQGDSFTSNTATCLGNYSYECYGGAIYSDETLSSTNDTFTSNSASANVYAYGYAYGGAIYSDSTMSSSGDTFKSNTAVATYYVYGGAVLSYSSLAMSNATFTSNSAVGLYETYGGALYNDGSPSTVNGSTFASNTASGNFAYGGGIYDDDDLQLNGSTLAHNSVTSGGGGGIYVESSGDVISNSTITGNAVTSAGYEDGGGGVFTDADSSIVNSTISGNTVNESGQYAGGGGIYAYDGVNMTGSTVSGNSVTGGSYGGTGGGGILTYDAVGISNSTISGNSSSSDGGGFENIYEGSKLMNVTLFGNTAAGSGGNIFNQKLSSGAVTMTISDSIAAGGTAATGPDIDNTGTITSNDYNIIQTAVAGTALAGTTTHNQTADPLLLALSNNSGPTFTMADQASSPGQADIPFTINNGSGVATCGNYDSSIGLITFDQRGFTRGANGRCDVGAYEFSGSTGAIRGRAPHVLGNHHPRHVRPNTHPHKPHPQPVKRPA